MIKRNGKNKILVIGMLVALMFFTPKLSYAGLGEDIIGGFTKAGNWLNNNIVKPAKRLVGLEEKEPMDSYSKYIGIDEKELSVPVQKKIEKARSLMHKNSNDFHFISRKYPTLEVFHDAEHPIQYIDENNMWFTVSAVSTKFNKKVADWKNQKRLFN